MFVGFLTNRISGFYITMELELNVAVREVQCYEVCAI